MKVLIVHPMFHVYGGAELAIVKLVDYLKAKKHTVDILTLVICPDVKNVLHADNIFFANNYPEMEQLLSGLVMNYNVINYHNHPAELLLKFPYPSVWFMNEPSEEGMKNGKVADKEVKQVNENITKIAVSDTYNKERVENLYGVKDATVIPYGVDYDYFRKGKGNRWFFKSSEGFTILQAAWIHPRKNQLKTLQVFKEFHDKHPDSKLILCGSITMPYIKTLMKYVEQNCLQKSVTIDGTFGNRDYLRNMYHSVDVLIQPITNQGGWITPLEAIVAGLPVIVSKEAVFASYFKEHKLATVTDNYIGVLEDIYKHKKKYKILTNKAKAYIKENLSWDMYSSKLEKLLKSVN